MKMLFKQRFFSWFDSYDIYDESGCVLYTVRGQLSWGHCLKIFDAAGAELGTVRERIFTFLPKFELYLGNRYWGCIAKDLSLFKPRYSATAGAFRAISGNGTIRFSAQTVLLSPLSPSSSSTGRIPTSLTSPTRATLCVR